MSSKSKFEPVPASQRVARDAQYQPVRRHKPDGVTMEQILKAHFEPHTRRGLRGIDRQLSARRLPDILREFLHWERRPVPQNDPDTIREFFKAESVRGASMSGGVALGAFTNTVNNLVQAAFSELEDTLDGIAAEAPIPNYLAAPIVQARDEHFLAQRPRGGTANLGTVRVDEIGAAKLVSMARCLVVDEQDMVNDTAGALAAATAQMGQAARRCWLDWAWADILANAALPADGIPLFDVRHENLTNAALTAEAIGAACAIIRKRRTIIGTGGQGADQVQYSGLEPVALIVAPEQEATARKELRKLWLPGNTMLDLRVEPRLSDGGVRHPITGDLYTGKTTNWMVTADNSVLPWIVKGELDYEETEPRVRTTTLDQGQYGTATDINYSVSCSIVDYRGAYFSTGDAT